MPTRVTESPERANPELEGFGEDPGLRYSKPRLSLARRRLRRGVTNADPANIRGAAS